MQKIYSPAILIQSTKSQSYIKYLVDQHKMFDLGRQSYLRPSTPLQPDPTNSNHAYLEKVQIKNEIGQEKVGVNFAKTTKGSGKWTLRENMRYLLFLEEYVHLFKDEKIRKKSHVFSLMNKFIRSRTTNQCKSHHQKMLKFYGKSEDIIDHLSTKYSPLKLEWKLFRQTQPRVLMNDYPEINSKQNVYRILKFNDVIQIEIDQSAIQSY